MTLQNDKSGLENGWIMVGGGNIYYSIINNYRKSNCNNYRMKSNCQVKTTIWGQIVRVHYYYLKCFKGLEISFFFLNLHEWKCCVLKNVQNKLRVGYRNNQTEPYCGLTFMIYTRPSSCLICSPALINYSAIPFFLRHAPSLISARFQPTTTFALLFRGHLGRLEVMCFFW